MAGFMQVIAIINHTQLFRKSIACFKNPKQNKPTVVCLEQLLGKLGVCWRLMIDFTVHKRWELLYFLHSWKLTTFITNF